MDIVAARQEMLQPRFEIAQEAGVADGEQDPPPLSVRRDFR